MVVHEVSARLLGMVLAPTWTDCRQTADRVGGLSVKTLSESEDLKSVLRFCQVYRSPYPPAVENGVTVHADVHTLVDELRDNR